MLDIFNHITIWHWFGLGITLVILDLLLGTSFFLLWLGVWGLIVGVVLWLAPTLSWEYQFIIYAIGAVTCIFFWHSYLKNNPTQSDKPRLNRRSEQYIGRTFTLEEAIVNGRGKIKVDDSTWRVEGDDLPQGVKVKVVSVSGVVLHVEKVEG